MADFSLEARGITFGYGGQSAVREVSLKLHAGEVVAIVGPNGSGKSTLLKLLLGLIRPNEGAVNLDGRPLSDLGEEVIAQRLSYVPQRGEIGFAYSVRQVVLMGRWPWRGGSMLGMATAADEAIALQAMWDADVHHLAERSITELSGGERQRALIARALAQQTPAILLDEPTTGLDPWHALEVLHHLRELAGKGSAILLVTHDLNLARDWATRVVVMNGGSIVADGTTPDVLVPSVLEPVYQVTVDAGPTGLRFRRR